MVAADSQPDSAEELSAVGNVKLKAPLMLGNIYSTEASRSVFYAEAYSIPLLRLKGETDVFVICVIDRIAALPR